MDDDVTWDFLNETFGMDWNDTTTASSIETSTYSTTTMSTTTQSTTPRPCFPSHIPRCDMFMKVIDWLQYYGGYSMVILGIPGNILVLIVVLRMKPLNSSSVWLVFLACSDLIQALVRCALNVLSEDTVMGPWKLNTDTTCRFFGIVLQTVEYTSYWFLVGLTVERFIAVWFPLKMSIVCTKLKAACGCCAIVVLTLASNLHLVETYRRHVMWYMCVIKGKYRAFWTYVWTERVQLSLFVTVPVLSLIVLNALIVVRLRTSSSIQKQISEAQAKEKAKQQAQINRMLLAATLWAIGTLFPFIIYFYYRQEAWFNRRDNGDPAQAYRMKYGMFHLLDVLRLTNVVANFVLYVIAARKFRNELIRLVTCNRFPTSKASKSTSSQSDTKMTTKG